MPDLRSGLCHGPDCSWHITATSPSEDFCSDACQTAWNASHAHPSMPAVSVHLPSPGMARWTPEGGAPVTPETSTWEPRQPDALNRYARDRWDEEGADRWAPDLPITDPGPIRTRLSIVPPTERPPATGGWVQLDDSDHPDWAWTDVSEYVSDTHGLERRSTVALRMTPVPPTIHAAPGEPEHLLPGDRFRVEQVGGRWQYKIVEVGEAATQSPIQERPWWSWLRGWLRG